MRWLVLALIVPTLAGCIGESGSGTDSGGATITWTAHGIPHIVADNFHDLGVGAGWAAAEDNLCLIAEEYVTVNGERSKYFGPGTYSISSNGQTYTNIQSDTFHRIFHDPDLVTSSALTDNPKGQDLLAGYLDGYNAYLEAIPEGRHESCRDAPWLRPITEDDMVRRVNKLQLLASSLFFAPYMVDASPLPGFAADVPAGIWPTPDNLGFGSNGYAFGSDHTGGAGLLLGNPHFSWHGPERFAQLHLTVPGEYDVMGATLMGVPLVLIGFNEGLAWTHTVSTGWRFTAYELKMVGTNQYLHDGQLMPITTRTADVEVLRNGQLVTEQHGIHFSHYGPIIEFPASAVAPAPGPVGDEVGLMWTPVVAYTIRDANAHNNRIFDQFFAFGTSKSVPEIEAALEDVHGVPWVNTIAADKQGRAFYADISNVANVPNAQWDTCNTLVGHALTAAANLPVFDGSRSECGWVTSRDDGILPASEMPRITTNGWVMNSNDSYWLPNPGTPLEGYSRMIGTEQSERSQRSRMGYVLIDEMVQGGIDMDELQAGLFSSRLHAAESALDDVLAETCLLGYGLSSSGNLVDFDTACKVLDTWDRTADVEARGLALFERFWLKLTPVWAVPFDADRPVATPGGLVGESPQAINALADAVEDLEQAGISLDASVAEARCVQRGEDCIPIHGARSELGSPSYISFAWSDDGFGDVLHGNSYIQTVTWDDNGPVAEALLAYSQSSDPASPHSADQTMLYSNKEWVPLPYWSADVKSKAVRSVSLR